LASQEGHHQAEEKKKKKATAGIDIGAIDAADVFDEADLVLE
jgi:hypothetical protein